MPRSLKLSPDLRGKAQAIVKLNFDNMQPVNGRAKEMADNATQLMVLLAVVGTAFGRPLHRRRQPLDPLPPQHAHQLSPRNRAGQSRPRRSGQIPR